MCWRRSIPRGLAGRRLPSRAKTSNRGSHAESATGSPMSALPVESRPLARTSLRQFAEADFDLLVRRWHETNLASYPYCAEHQRHSLDDAFAFFRGKVLVQCEVWVADASGELLGLIALRAPWIDQFAVFPEHQRRGVGTAL